MTLHELPALQVQTTGRAPGPGHPPAHTHEAPATRWNTLPAVLALVAFLGLAGCALGPTVSASQLYDLGPPPAVTAPAAPTQPGAAPTNASPLAFELQAAPTLDGNAMAYRLAYSDPRQLRTYRDARWAASPGELLEARLRTALASASTLLPSGETGLRTLHVDLLDMSQSFDRPDHSTGVLRLRVTLLARGDAGVMVLAQREAQWQAEAPTADAAGGARALQQVCDAAAADLLQWLSTAR